jgi:hypothetical protein
MKKSESIRQGYEYRLRRFGQKLSELIMEREQILWDIDQLHDYPSVQVFYSKMAASRLERVRANVAEIRYQIDALDAKLVAMARRGF